MKRALLAAFSLPSLAACFLFSVDNRPCTVNGECLPSYTCVKGLCVKAGVRQISESCFENGECVGGAVCEEAYCDDSAKTSCAQASDCPEGGDEKFICRNKACVCKRQCRPGCDFPDVKACSSGQLCWSQVGTNLGYCQQGFCGSTDDGTVLGSCLDSEACVNFNGPGSGLCLALCDILQQNQACQQSPPPDGVLCCGAGQNCEHYNLVIGLPANPDNAYGICFDGGIQNEGDPCSNLTEDNRFCARGLVCMNNVCVKYCNLANPGSQPACGGGQNCIALPGAEGFQLPFGRCR